MVFILQLFCVTTIAHLVVSSQGCNLCLVQDLRELIDKQQEQIKKLKKALKVYAKRLKSTEGELSQFISLSPETTHS